MGEKRKEIRLMKLLDTDIFIDFFRGVNEASRFILENVDEIVFSSISEVELLSGNICNIPKERERVFHLLSQFEKIAVDNPLVQVAGSLRRTYNLELPDAIIAASALAVDAILITRNAKEFDKIKGLKVQKPY